MALAITALIIVLLLSIAAAAAGQAEQPGRVDIGRLLLMTTIQAGLSTILSLLVGMALAWALNRLRFPGRELLIGLFSAAIVTPGIIVAFGLLSVWGRAGWVNSAALAVFGHPLEVPLFGLGGILAAHVILDGAFAARVLLARLDAVPAARLKTGQSLGLTPWRRFAVIDWPALAGTLPGLAAIIFLVAFTSFPIVLLLGGGPANQTLEVAIYSAVRLDFDLSGAVLLALVQIATCAVIILCAAAFPPVAAVAGPSRAPTWRDGGIAHLAQVLVLLVATLGFASPLLAILLGGIDQAALSVLSRPGFWSALGWSLGIAATSAILAVVAAMIVGAARAASADHTMRTAIGVPAYAYLAVPAVVLSLGFFLAIRGLGVLPETVAPAVIVIANALLSLPFAMATLAPPLDAIVRRRGRLIRALGLTGWRQFAYVEWPLLARDAGLALALAFCFSLGDLGVIALFGTDDFETLPLMMYRALGAYRSNDAAAIAALMLLLTVGVFVALPRLFGKLADAQR